jgi:hypothetical protein
MMAGKVPVEVKVEGLENTPSVWIERGSKGELRYGIKLYGTNVKRIEAQAKTLFKRMEKFAQDLNRTTVRGGS